MSRRCRRAAGAALCLLRLYLMGLLFIVLNCYTLALVERLRHGRGRIVRMRGYRDGHYGLELEHVIVHYLPHLRSWWGWRRHLECR